MGLHRFRSGFMIRALPLKRFFEQGGDYKFDLVAFFVSTYPPNSGGRLLVQLAEGLLFLQSVLEALWYEAFEKVVA